MSWRTSLSRSAISPVSLALFLFTTSTLAGTFTAAAVRADINAIGAKAVVAKLWGGSGWDQLMANVRTGQSDWLKVAVEIYPGTDAGASETLALAVGEALVMHPREVLRIVAPAMGTEEICTGPDIDWYPVKDKYVAALDQRIAAVSALQDESLSGVRASCLKSLADQKTYILSPKGPYQ